MNYYNPVAIKIGMGIRSEALANGADRLLVICSSGGMRRLENDKALRWLFHNPNATFEHDFSSNPSLSEIASIATKHQHDNFEMIVGIGGGSALDVAKVCSVTIPAGKRGCDIVELLRTPDLINQLEKIPTALMPTTAGTGSEVTPFATIWDYQTREKKSLSHPKLFADDAIIDGELIANIPLNVAISTGLDALNQAFESLWNKNANDLTRSIAVTSASLSLTALPQLKSHTQDISLLEKLSRASVLAGLAISQTRTSICHSISYPLTMNYGVDHGMACAFSMLEVYKFNKNFLHDELALLESLTGTNPFKQITDIFTHLGVEEALRDKLPPAHVLLQDLDGFVTAGRFDNNIRPCSPKDLRLIIKSSIGRLAS